MESTGCRLLFSLFYFVCLVVWIITLLAFRVVFISIFIDMVTTTTLTSVSERVAGAAVAEAGQR
jgi:hypothetical protein